MNNWKIKFGVIWSGQAISFFTSAILQMALIWHLTITTESALVLAVASIAGFLPMAVMGSFAGALVDRFNRKHVMIAADLYVAAISLLLVIFGLFAEPPLAVYLAVIFLRSIGTTFHNPAITAVTPLIVPAEHLTKAAGYTQTVQTLGFIAGTSVAAVLYPLIGVSGMVMMDVAGAVLASAAVMVVVIPKVPKKEETEDNDNNKEPPKQKTSLFAEVKAGYAVLRQSKGLHALLWTGMVFSFAFASINAMYPLMSLGYFDAGTTGAAVVEALFAVGMMLGGLLLGVWGGFKNRAVSMILATAICGVGILASGFLPQYGFAEFLPRSGFVAFVVLSFIIGASAPLYQGPSMSLFQQRIAPEYLGRVFGLIGSVSSLAMLVGLVTIGFFGDLIGVQNAFIASGSIITALAVVLALLPGVRNIEKEK